MRLAKSQKEFVLQLIAEGRTSGEISQLAAQFVPPFTVSRSQIDYYRKSRLKPFRARKLSAEKSALSKGFAVREKRVETLNELAEKLRDELLGETDNKLWLERRKCIGGGEHGEFIDEIEFNDAEVSQFRGLLDDIAKEMGERKPKDDGANPNNVEIKIYTGFDPEKV